MENNLIGAKSRGFMVGMRPHSFPSITIPISFKRKDSGNPPLHYQVHLTSSLARFFTPLAQPSTLPTLPMHWAKPNLCNLHQLYRVQSRCYHITEHKVYQFQRQPMQKSSFKRSVEKVSKPEIPIKATYRARGGEFCFLFPLPSPPPPTKAP